MSHDSLNSIVSVFLDTTFLPTLINQVCSSKVFVIQTNNFTISAYYLFAKAALGPYETTDVVLFE